MLHLEIRSGNNFLVQVGFPFVVHLVAHSPVIQFLICLYSTSCRKISEDRSSFPFFIQYEMALALAVRSIAYNLKGIEWDGVVCSTGS